MEIFIGVAIWVTIFIVWYVKTYPEKFRGLNVTGKIKGSRLRKKKAVRPVTRLRPRSGKDFRTLVEIVESISSQDTMGSSDCAAMVEAIKDAMQIEAASGQLWEALALDAMETAEIICDECGIPVKKTVKKTGVKIECPKCGKWLALKNSKVTIIDPKRGDLEEWEH